MENLCKIAIIRAEDTSALKNFKCGIQSMDDFIHDEYNGLAKFIKLRLSNLWLVYENNIVVAFFALSKDALMLNNDDRQAIEHNRMLASPEDSDMFWDKEKYPAIEIDYLAVSEEKREKANNHLGTIIINEIAKQALRDEFSATLFLTVEALDTKEYSAVDFYRSCDFEFSEVAINQYNYKMVYGNQPSTRRMYKILFPEV